ncbi:MAG: hypothetical protein FJ117_16770 [Deltaproteobacteria bacterium]|nr:hypothetical protein [Deltaproteobacteria bacterium]
MHQNLPEPCLPFHRILLSCGLRLHEGLHLEVSDIDSTRMMIHVHRGKGAKDRYAEETGGNRDALKILR